METVFNPLMATLKPHSNGPLYRVGQIKRGQLTFLLVSSERVYKIKRFLADFLQQQVT